MLNEIDLSRTDLNLLVVFEAVLRERHVGRAAARLNLTPSAVSHGLSRLRAQFGDPLFLKHPKGVVPTARAVELAGAIDEVLARARAVFASLEPFVPARSRRRFVLGAPDAISSVILPPLLAELRERAPGIDLGVRQVLPLQAIEALDARHVDVAVVPLEPAPSRLAVRELYEDEFVIAARARHPWLGEPTLDGYCRHEHLVVSTEGDLHGFVDDVLATSRRSRRVAVASPNYMLALALLASSDLLAALPRTLVEAHGARHGLRHVRAPFALPVQRMRAVVPAAALGDPAFAWLLEAIARASPHAPTASPPAPTSSPAAATRLPGARRGRALSAPSRRPA